MRRFHRQGLGISGCRILVGDHKVGELAGFDPAFATEGKASFLGIWARRLIVMPRHEELDTADGAHFHLGGENLIASAESDPRHPRTRACLHRTLQVEGQ